MELVFPQPIAVRSVHLYNPNTTSEVDVHVHEARVRLFADLATQQEVATAMSGDLTSTGTAIPFEDLAARVVRIEILDVTGQFEGQTVASLGEVEVISQGLPASIVISPIHQPFSIRPVLEGSALKCRARPESPNRLPNIPFRIFRGRPRLRVGKGVRSIIY